MDVNSDLVVALMYASFLSGSELALLNFRLRADEVKEVFARRPAGSFLAGMRYAAIARSVAGDGLADSIGLLDSDGFDIVESEQTTVRAGPIRV